MRYAQAWHLFRAWSGTVSTRIERNLSAYPLSALNRITYRQSGQCTRCFAVTFDEYAVDDYVRQVDGGEMDILSFGVNWWLSPIFNVNFNYRFITNDKDGLSGDAQGVMGRVLLILE